MVSDTKKSEKNTGEDLRLYLLKAASGELPDLQKKVLLKIAHMGPLSIYELMKELGIDKRNYSSTHQAVKALENQKLVKYIQKKNIKNVYAKIYSLTESGVLVLIVVRPEGFNLRKCLSFFKSPYPLPMIKILEAFGEDYAAAFRDAFIDYSELLPSMTNWKQKKKNEFFLSLFLPRIASMNFDKGKFIQTISGDKKLKKMLVTGIDEIKNKLDLLKINIS